MEHAVGSGSVKKQANGFSLIEVIIVVAILALLSIIAMQIFGPQQGKARDAKRLANIDYLQNKLEIYYTEHNEYPVATDYVAVRDLLAATYEARITDINDPGNLQYYYEGSEAGFCLCAQLERGAEANSSGPDCSFGGTTHYCVQGVQ